jgi:serine protease Do
MGLIPIFPHFPFFLSLHQVSAPLLACHPIRLAALRHLLVALLLAVSGSVYGQTPSSDLRALRRNAAVDVFDKWNDAVVYVTGPILPPERPNVEEFFRLPGQKFQQMSVGSGFVFHSSGYILTNAHATDKVISQQVRLADGKTYPADLIAMDHEHDVAVLKIDAGRPLNAVKLGASGDVMTGESVIVIANPHGLAHTCTTGVVSAVGRTTAVLDIRGLTLHDLLQTDASINPGSSGGPWFNVLGEVIGLTTTKKRDADNIGFAVPTSTLRQQLTGMLDVERHYGLLTGLTLERDGPARVAKVEPDSPAAKANLHPGDVIARLEDTPTPTVLDYHLALIGRKQQQSLALEVERGGQLQSTALTPAVRPKLDAVAVIARKLGITVAPLDSQKARAMILQVDRGALVTAVDPKFYASVQHPPAVGDVLARVAGIRFKDLDQLALIVDKYKPGEMVPLVLLRLQNNLATRIDIRLVLP